MSRQGVRDRQFTNGAAHTFSSATEIEAITGSDQTPTINDGVAMGIYCDVAGSVLQFTTSKMSGTVTITLPAGFAPFEVTGITGAGTTLAGNAFLLAW